MEAILKEGLAQLGLDTGSIPALTEFSRRLLEKNQVMNLTAITDPKDVATLHFLDCASLLTLADFSGKTVADVAAPAGLRLPADGGGLPGQAGGGRRHRGRIPGNAPAAAGAGF